MLLDVPVSDVLRECVEKAGISQSELARATGVPQPSISRFLKGDRGLSLEHVDRLAEYFGLALLPEDKSPKRKR